MSAVLVAGIAYDHNHHKYNYNLESGVRMARIVALTLSHLIRFVQNLPLRELAKGNGRGEEGG